MVANHLHPWTSKLKRTNTFQTSIFQVQNVNLPGCTSQLGGSSKQIAFRSPPSFRMFPLHETEASGKPRCRRPLERGAILEVNHHGGSFWMMINPYQSYYKNGGFVNYPLNNGGWKGNARFQKRTPWVVLMPHSVDGSDHRREDHLLSIKPSKKWDILHIN